MRLDTTGIESVEEQSYTSDELAKDSSELDEVLKEAYVTAKTEGVKADTEERRNTTKLKKDLADRAFDFMVRFTNFIGIILMVYVGHFLVNDKPLPENFMIALITTTLATVVGLVGFILKGLFGSKD